MDIVHLEDIAKHCSVSVMKRQHSAAPGHITPPRARHTGQPIEQMQPCTRPIAFSDGAR